MIKSDKDYNDIKNVFIEHYIETKQLLTVQEFNRIKPNHLKELRYYFNKHLINYNELVYNNLGFVKIINKRYSKNRIYNKNLLKENIEIKAKEIISKGNTLLSKNIKNDLGISLKELKEIFNLDFVELHEELNIEHSLSLIRKNNKFDWSIACKGKISTK